jgi:hypothetical protein
LAAADIDTADPKFVGLRMRRRFKQRGNNYATEVCRSRLAAFDFETSQSKSTGQCLRCKRDLDPFL